MLSLQPETRTKADKQRTDTKILGNIIESVHFMVLIRIVFKRYKHGLPQPKDYPINDQPNSSFSRTM
jgi:hypothetical protein